MALDTDFARFVVAEVVSSLVILSAQGSTVNELLGRYST